MDEQDSTPVAEQETPASSNLKYSPRAVGGVNFLFVGAGYLILRRYKRFFLMLAIFLVVTSLLGLAGGLLVVLFIVYDSVRIAKKVQAGEEQLGEKVRFLVPVLIIVMLLVMIFTYTPAYMFAYNEESCDFFYPAQINPFESLSEGISAISDNLDCKRKVKRGETIFTMGAGTAARAITSEECENEHAFLKNPCYYNKAVDSGNYAYCFSSDYPDLCIKSLALTKKDRNVCEESAYPLACEDALDRCAEDSTSYRCNIAPSMTCESISQGRDPQIYEECVQKYGSQEETPAQ